ncbi:hypothetical protein [Pseudonocardia sp. ICBG601]|uniref:hypothetical protein n=1 Tax=Pseudonocardia sp. ICBG601 TaxID=2846759 RepID=UPI001CF62237|nr:hypothetical protein [Pseudonocardia sp. ICBG601]
MLYRHFADRADLQRAVSEHAADMLMQRIYPVLAIDAEPIEHVAAVIDAYLGMIEESPSCTGSSSRTRPSRCRAPRSRRTCAARSAPC